MPKQRFGDIYIYYEITGEGQPLLFIHGLGSSTRDWEEQVLAFSKKYQVITVDVRGHGKTDKPEGPYTMPMFAKDIAGLLNALEIGSTHVVGLSLGGTIAFQLVVDYPEIVKSLIIVNSGPGSSGDLDTVMDQEFLRRKKIVESGGMREMGKALAPILFIKPEQEENRKKFVERWAENDEKAYLNAFKSFLGWGVTEHLSEIKCPTLVIGSDQDYSPTSIKEKYTALIPNAKLVEIQDARHAIPMEKPKEFNVVLMEFLSKLA